jgi:hypothetical protein
MRTGRRAPRAGEDDSTCHGFVASAMRLDQVPHPAGMCDATDLEESNEFTESGFDSDISHRSGHQAQPHLDQSHRWVVLSNELRCPLPSGSHHEYLESTTEALVDHGGDGSHDVGLVLVSEDNDAQDNWSRVGGIPFRHDRSGGAHELAHALLGALHRGLQER